MNKNIATLLGVIVVAGVAGTVGHWWGARSVSTSATQAASPESTQPANATAQPRKLLFYRNPMGLPDTSPTPKKDPMGMDYIAVYEGEDAPDAASITASTAPGSGALKFSADKIQKMGVRTEVAALRVLDSTVHASGRIEPDERRISTIAPRFEGYVEKLHVNATGQAVAKGQPLFEVYSPDLVAAQREYAIALQGVQALAQAGPDAQKGMQQLADASLMRLRNWNISEDQIKGLEYSGTTRHTLTVRSPVSGIITEKKAVQGMRFMPGDALYQVSDLTSVWVVADVAEQDIAAVRVGARATVRINAYPDKNFTGTVSYIYPALNAETRTVPVRLDLANPGALLKPGMFAQVDVGVGSRAKVVTVPTSAVIDSGKRQLVIVQLGEGRFEPREVTLGARTDAYLEVRSGVREGESVVVTANFLIDAESNLKAAVAGFGQSAPPSLTPAPTPAPSLAPSPAPAATSTGHQAQGTVVEVDATDNSVTVRHGPIASLKWGAMTMDFKLANSAMLKDVKPGVEIAFEIVERAKGEWVITKVTPMARAGSASAPHHP
jgi:RND family efflux transporter MFP subunit